MLAIIENGFSQLSKIETHSDKNQTSSNAIDAGVGTSNVFAFLGLGLGVNAKKDKSSSDGKSIIEDRIHTPTSLFYRLRKYLIDQKILQIIEHDDQLDSISSGDMIEVCGTLRRNPIIGVLDSAAKMMETAAIFTKLGQQDIKKGQKTDPNKVASDTILSQMKAVRDSLENSEATDILCKTVGGNATIVLPTYSQYFFNRSKDEITDGQYRVLGKVIKNVNEDSDEINLLRNTGFSLIKTNKAKGLFAALSQVSTDTLDIPEIVTSIKKPAILMIPIAIFV